MLNNKQKSYLRKMANSKNALFQVGKDGCSENLYKTINDSLVVHELIKISVLKTCPSEIREVAFDIASSTQSQIIQIIGRVVTIYRPNNKERKIILP